jgi:TFIIF-interacting CTD phosphatase-like protein
VSKCFEIVAYSSMSQRYTDALVSRIELRVGHVISMALSSEHCLIMSSLIFVKNLSILSGNREVEDIMCVDSNMFNYLMFTQHIVPVSPFRMGVNDDDVARMGEYLEQIASKHESGIISLKKSIIMA